MLHTLKRYAQREWQARRAARGERRATSATLRAINAANGRAPIEVPILGHPMRAFSRDNLQYLFTEVFMRREYAFDSPRPDPVIIDCGANIGMATLFFKRQHPASVIHAFEANPHAVALLRENVTRNRLSNVTLYAEALSDKDGALTFYISDDKGTLLGSTSATRGGHIPLQVPARRLSTLLHTLDRVDVVKMDVEGSEWAIVADLIDSGQFSKPLRYLLEYHHQIGGEAPRLSEFLRYFDSMGYRYTLTAQPADGPTGFQDVMIHAAREP